MKPLQYLKINTKKIRQHSIIRENGQKQTITPKDSSFRTKVYLSLEDFFLSTLDCEYLCQVK